MAPDMDDKLKPSSTDPHSTDQLRNAPNVSSVEAKPDHSLRNRRLKMVPVVGVPVLALLGVASLLSASSAHISPLPPPPKVPVAPTSSSVVEATPVSLLGVTGTTAPLDRSAAIPGGSASISGVIRIGGAPAGGATVHLDRFVDNKSQGMDVTAGPDGRYVASGITGGRYRVRAFRAPDAYSESADVFFLGNSESKSFDLNLTATNARTAMSWAVGPNPPILNQRANVVVSISTSAVGGDGVARTQGVSGVVLRLDSDGGRRIDAANVQTTDGNGRAAWQITCVATDRQGLTLTTADGRTQAVSVAGCQLPPSTTVPTTTAGDPTTPTAAPNNPKIAGN